MELHLRGFSIPVLAGQEYGVVFSAEFRPGNVTAFSVDTATANDGGGSMYIRSLGLGWTWMAAPESIGDLLFRTYVDCVSADACTAAVDPPPHQRRSQFPSRTP